MAGSRGSKYFDVFLKYNVWLQNTQDQTVTNHNHINLLKGIKQSGSLMAASKDLKISYRKAWGCIKDAEELLGFNLVEKQRGGSKGGNTTVTKEGIELIEAFDELQTQIEDVLHHITKRFFNRINAKQ